MSIFGSKPPPASAKPKALARSPSPSPASALPPKAGTSPTGTLLLGEIRETKDRAQQAVNYLEAMANPQKGEQPTQVQEMVDCLTLVLTEVQALRTEMRELRALVSPPSRRTPA